MIDHDLHAHDNEADKALWNSIKPVSDLMETFQHQIVAALGIPRRVLFGEDKDGPRATVEIIEDRGLYSKIIGDYQNDWYGAYMRPVFIKPHFIQVKMWLRKRKTNKRRPRRFRAI